MKKVKIMYHLSQKGMKQSILEGGSGEEHQIIEVDVTPELLERAVVNRDGSIVWNIERVAKDADITGTGYYDKPCIVELPEKILFDTPQTVESLLEFARNMENKLREKKNELEAILPEKVAQWEKANAEAERKKAERVELRRIEEEKVEEEKVKREKEKYDWVFAHGSEHLKKAISLGYDCQRKYIQERAALEFPDYTVDFDRDYSWKDRACPSKEALDEVEQLVQQGYSAQVVWLTDDGTDDYEREFEPHEAIMLYDYCGKYYLIRSV